MMVGENDLTGSEFTDLLSSANAGDSESRERLIETVYLELHRRASRLLSMERPGHTLQTTALLNEALLRLLGGRVLAAIDRNHFLNLAAQQMRRVLVDHARARQTNKRKGLKLSLEDAGQISLDRGPELVALDDALNRLEQVDPEAARVVDLKYFGGYTDEETKEILGVSVATVRRHWEYARAWLHDFLSEA